MNIDLPQIKSKIKSFANVHKPSDLQNFFLFTMPRSGSTWLMELLCSQPGFKYCNEPFYLKNPLVRHYSKLNNWTDIYDGKKDEIIKNYFQKIVEGKLGFLNPNPLGAYYRPFTNRIVFKVIHGGEEQINWFKENFNGKIIYLIRHPMAVSISRKMLPRLETLIESKYGENFTPDQRTYARETLKKGNHLEKAVLSWCLQNGVPLRDKKEGWVFITYEQMVTNPNLVLQYLQKELNLVNLEKIKENLEKPSLVKSLSDDETKKMLENNNDTREVLISKWRKKVSLEEEKHLWDIIEAFDIDVYNYNQCQANEKYLVK